LGAIYQLLPIFFPGLKPSSAKEMKTYFLPTTGSSAIITGTKMSLIVPYSTNLSSLSAEFYHTGKSSKINGVEQISGQTINNHSQALIYTITAANATQKNYTISTTKGSPDSNTLFGFQFDSVNARGLITGTSVTINLPYGTDIKKLVPTFSHNGSKMFFNNIEQVSGKTQNDFTNPVLYEVQAEDGSKRQYTIVVVSGTLTSNTIQGISVDGNTGFINGESIYFNFSSGENISSVSPFISHLGTSVTVNGQPFVNGETILDFTQPLKVRITSADGAAKEYTIYSGFIAGNRLQSFTDLGNQTIKDNNTGLIWMQCAMSITPGVPLTGNNCLGGTIGQYKYCRENDNDCNGGTNTGAYGSLITSSFSGTYPGSYGTLYDSVTVGADHYTAYKACNDANLNTGFANKTTWRVPTREELVSIVDYSVPAPSINSAYFPNTPSVNFWTSSPYAFGSTAWITGFNGGHTDTFNKSITNRVRCVSSP
jgi:hypothetical protein